MSENNEWVKWIDTMEQLDQRKIPISVQQDVVERIELLVDNGDPLPLAIHQVLRDHLSHQLQ